MAATLQTTTADRAPQRFQEELDAYLPNLRAALPAHVSADKFARVLTTAVSSNPDLAYADRRSLFNAAVQCASDGLLPDGREAALVVYNTKVKRRNPETGISHEIRMDVVQYMPMIAGIRKRMRNSGDVISAIAEVVYHNDKFTYRLGDDAIIEHTPAPLGEDRGIALGAYAIITLKSGEVVRDVMTLKEIEVTRGQSRAKDAMMWTKFWGEAARKTVLRRCAKQAPQTSEMEAMLDHDHHFAPGDQLVHLPAPPEPERLHSLTPPEDTRPEYHITDPDGVVTVLRSPAGAIDGLDAVLTDAAKLGLAQLDGAWESNLATIETLEADDMAALATQYQDARRALTTPEPRQATTRPRAANQPAPVEATPEPEPEPPPAAHPDDRPFPGDMPSSAPPANDEGGKAPLTIAPPLRNGNPDWRTWAVALFLPKLRQVRDREQLPFFLGDNNDHLTAALPHLSVTEAQEVNQAIANQWQVVG